VYVAAQRVRSASGVGINVFIYRHASAKVPTRSDGAIDVVRVAEEFPGQLVSSNTQIPPGGNEVLSYLDIAAADGTSVDQLASLSLPRKPGGIVIPHVWPHNGIGARFGTRSFVHEAAAAEEFGQLKDAMIDALRSPQTTRKSGAAPPLTIEVSHLADVLSFSLKQESRERLLSLGVSLPAVGSINITTTTLDDFEAVLGAFARHVAPLLTNMALDQLSAVGGVQFVPASGGDVIWELTRPIHTNATTLPELADWANALLAQAVKSPTIELEPVIAAELEQFESRFMLLVDDIERLPPERNPLALGLEPRPGKILYKDKAVDFLKRALLAVQPS